jgi:PTS system nitrogen regulatory IIA component
MPFEIMDTQQVAGYLRMDERDVTRLASRGKLPCQKRKRGFVFLKNDIDHWVEIQLHELPHHRLAQIEAGVRRHHGIDREELLVCKMVPPGGIAAPLASRTAGSVLRDLVDLADRSSLVNDREALLEAVGLREQLCSTALLPYTALPHPRHALPYDISQSFVVVGRSDNGIPFSAPDGSLTRLFFLMCCKDDRTHLHVLARISRMLQRREVIDDLLHAADADALRETLVRAEREALTCPVDR